MRKAVRGDDRRVRDFLDLLAIATCASGADPVVTAVLRDFAWELLCPEPEVVIEPLRTIGSHVGPLRDT